MIRASLPFSELQFSKLFSDYCRDFDLVADLYDHNPFSEKASSEKYRILPAADRTRLSELLLVYNHDFMHFEPVRRNMDILANDRKSAVVVTGQQMTIGGGPLYTLFKIITAISKARSFSEKLGVPVVPVFWLADEDHDFIEMARIGMPVSDGWSDLTFAMNADPYTSSGFIRVNEHRDEIIQFFSDNLAGTDFKSEVMDWLSDCYTSEKTHAEAFGSLISVMFSRYGLLLAGSAHPEVKSRFSEVFAELITRTDEVNEALEKQSELIEKRYHRQAQVGGSNWFRVEAQGRRSKLNRENGRWQVAGKTDISDEALADMVRTGDIVLSPNVFMRPLFQDMILPVLAYIAGPGEIAYYGQMRGVYSVFGLSMPLIIPRLSATILEVPIARSFDELPMQFPDYALRPEDLERLYVERAETFDIQSFADKWMQQVSTLADDRTSLVEQFDASLVGTLVRIRNEQINLVNSLRQKMIRSAKNREEVQIRRLNKIRTNLFPNRNMQEREMAFAYLLNKYGFGIVDKLLELTNNATLQQHHVLELVF